LAIVDSSNANGAVSTNRGNFIIAAYKGFIGAYQLARHALGSGPALNKGDIEDRAGFVLLVGMFGVLPRDNQGEKARQSG
jgi:hypothetical protein